MSDKHFLFSSQGAQAFPTHFSQEESAKNLLWTTNKEVELPIKMSQTGVGSLTPQNFNDMFQATLLKHAGKPALSQKINGAWDTVTYQQYYEKCLEFAQACLNHGIPEGSAVNIIGFNCREWFYSFIGSILCGFLPVGVYTTNNAEACKYVAEHSECSLVIVENNQQLEKYMQIWDQLPNLKKIVVINDKPNAWWSQKPNQILDWKSFMQPITKAQIDALQPKMNIFPGI